MGKLMKFNKGKAKSCTWDRLTLSTGTAGPKCLIRSFADKDPGVFVDVWLKMRQHWTLE